jgi:hypothetical protein
MSFARSLNKDFGRSAISADVLPLFQERKFREHLRRIPSAAHEGDAIHHDTWQMEPFRSADHSFKPRSMLDDFSRAERSRADAMQFQQPVAQSRRRLPGGRNGLPATTLRPPPNPKRGFSAETLKNNETFLSFRR